MDTYSYGAGAHIWSVLLLLLTLQLVLEEHVVLSFFRGIQSMHLKSNTSKLEEIQSNVADLLEVSKLLAIGEKVVQICPKPLSIWIAYSDVNYSVPSTSTSDDSSSVSSGGGGADLYMLNFTGDTRRDCAPGYPKIKSFRHVGSLQTELPAISLFNAPQFRGVELWFSGALLHLPEQFLVSSYGFTGTEKWEVVELWPMAEGGNVSRCLQRPAWAHERYPWLEPSFVRSRAVNVSVIARQCQSKGSRALDPSKETASAPMATLRLFLHPPTDGKSLFLEGVPGTPLWAPLELRLPRTFSIASAIMPMPDSSGGTSMRNNSWQLYSGTRFDGTTFCLNTTEHYFGPPMQVGSIKFGCGYPVGMLKEEVPFRPRPLASFSSGGTSTWRDPLSIPGGVAMQFVVAALLLLVPLQFS